MIGRFAPSDLSDSVQAGLSSSLAALMLGVVGAFLIVAAVRGNLPRGRPRRHPMPWPLAVSAAAGVGVWAVDVSHLPGFPGWWWSTLYGVGAVGLLAWRVWLFPWLLAAAGVAVFSATFARIVVFAVYTDRYSGIVYNTFIAFGVVSVLRAQIGATRDR